MLINQTNIEIYNLIFNDDRKKFDKNTNWDNIVKSSSSHLILPLLYYKIKKLRINAPKDLKNYLKYINKHNRERNLQLIKEIKLINKLFKKLNIEHVFLKGSAMILGEYFECNSNRMLGDIDILIKKEDYKKCRHNLQLMNYKSSKNYNLLNHRHFPRLISREKKFAIELHTEVLRNSYIKLLPSLKIFNNKANSKYNIPIPSEKHLLLNALYNQQINDYGYLKGTFDFRTFYDIFVLEKNIDVKKIVKSKYFITYTILKEIFNKKDSDKNKKLIYYLIKFRLLFMSKFKLLRIFEKGLFNLLIKKNHRFRLLKDMLKDKTLRTNTIERLFKKKL